MPSEWRETTWGELATLEYGKSLRGYSDAVGAYRVFGTNGPIGWHTEPLCPFPSVVIGRKGAYRGVHFSPTPFFVIDTAFYLKPKVELDIRWAYYQLLTQDINGMDSGSAIPSTSREEFYKLPAVVPPTEMQREIAATLTAFDDKIALLRETNATLEAIAQALFKSWFVDFDPVRAKAEGRDPEGVPPEVADLFPSAFEDSELGEIPKGWAVRSLDSFATYLNGLALQKYPPKSDDSFLPVIKIAQLRAGNTLGADRASAQLKPEYIVHDGDILFSWSGSLEVEIWCGGDGALNQHLFKVASGEMPKWFYYLATRHFLPSFRETAAHKATTMGHIQRKHLTESRLALPPAEVLAALSEFVGPIVEKRITNALQARELGTLRDTLLPRLISGKLRIPQIQETVEVEEAIA